MNREFGVCAILYEADGSIRADRNKTRDADRLVLFPAEIVALLMLRKAGLHYQGFSDEEIDQVYIFCKKNEPFSKGDEAEMPVYLRRCLMENRLCIPNTPGIFYV